MADEIKKDWRAVGIDFTRHYNIREEDKAHIERIIEVFFYDKNEHTHLCELTPSYYLRHLHTFIIFKGEPSDTVREELDMRYCYEGMEDTYMHVSDVDRKTEFNATYGEGSAEATEDEVREYWQANWPI